MFESVVSVKAAKGSEGNAVALTFVILVWKQTQLLLVLLVAVVGINEAVGSLNDTQTSCCLERVSGLQ